MHYNLCVLFSQLAPQRCDWHHVSSFVSVCGKTDVSFEDFLLNLPLTRITDKSMEDMMSTINAASLNHVITDYLGLLHARGDDERVLQAPIHSTLVCAAVSLDNKYDSYIHVVVAEPAFVVGRQDHLADETILECIGVEDSLMRVLLEVKGSSSYSYQLHGSEVTRHVSQMLQQVALAYENGRWLGRIMCGLVTATEWNLFEVRPIQLPSGDYLDIIARYNIVLPVFSPRTVPFPSIPWSNSLKRLIAFIMDFLESTYINSIELP